MAADHSCSDEWSIAFLSMAGSLAGKRGLKDKDVRNPVSRIAGWKDAEKELKLPLNRVGDLVIANQPIFGWVEDVSADLKIFKDSLKSGYKQAIIPEETDAMFYP